MSKNITKNLIYHNIKVLGPDGKLMFLCNQDKIDWYLSRALAEPTEDKLTFRLLFCPKGKGHAKSSLCLQERENKCVVCGRQNNLSKHHVVPYCYRMHFPANLKEHTYYDVLPVCRECHDWYEIKYSANLRKNLAKQYNAPINGRTSFSSEAGFGKASKFAYALVNYSEFMPESRKNEILSFLREFSGKNPSEEDIKRIARNSTLLGKDSSYKTHGELVVKSLTDLQSFIEMWRRDFVDNMKPLFLPNDWSIDYKNLSL